MSMGTSISMSTRETDIGLRPEDVTVKDAERTLVESLDLDNRLAAAMQETTREQFAKGALGMDYIRWWRWRSKGKAPVKVVDYLHIIARFPELRGKVWRHLLHRALTEIDSDE